MRDPRTPTRSLRNLQPGDSTSVLLAMVLAVFAVWSAFAILQLDNAPFFFPVALLIGVIWLAQPELGCFLTIFLSFLDFRTQVLGVNLRLYELVTTFVVASYLFSENGRAQLRRSVELSPIRPIMSYLVFGLLSIAYSVAPLRTLTYSLRLGVAIMFASQCCLLVGGGSQVERKTRSVLAAGLMAILALGFVQLAFGGAFLSLLRDGFYVLFVSGESVLRGERGSFFFGHYGNLRPFSFFATPHIHTVVIGVVTFYLFGSKLSKRRFRILASLGVLQLLLADVYGALLALVAGVAAIIVASVRRYRMLAYAALAVTASGTLALVGRGLLRVVSDVAAASYFGRLQLWQEGWEAFLDRPLLGHGVGSAPHLLAQSAAKFGYQYDHFHNWYLEILAETGIVGMIVVLYVVFALLKRSFRCARSAMGGKAPIGILTFYLGFSLVDSFVGGGNVAFALFLVILAIALSECPTAVPHARHVTHPPAPDPA